MVALVGAEVDRLLGSWGATTEDPDDAFYGGGQRIADRGIWLYENDPVGHAICDTFLRGILGSQGLRHRSLYSVDDNPEATDEEDTVRRQINASVRSSCIGTRFDAGGLLSRRDMSRLSLLQCITTGAGFAQKLWKPNRRGNQVHATCWRLIHSSRVTNPDFGCNTDRWVNGFKLNDDGDPVAIGVMKRHPATSRTGRGEWVEVPMSLPDGSVNLTYLPSFSQPGQLRGPGWFNQVIPLLRFLGRTMEAKVIADLMKASIGFIIECEDPQAMANQDKNGAVLTSTTKIKPGMKYYVKKGTNWKEFNLNFNGSDFNNWGDFLLKMICANFGIPWQFVMQQLTQSNLASSRTALMQAYNTFAVHQESLIAYQEEPWTHSIITEDLARGRIIASTTDVDRLYRGRFLRPARPFPDPLKEAQSNVIKTKQLGFSLSGVHADSGSDFEDEIGDGKVDRETMARAGYVPESMNGQPAADAEVDDPEDTQDEPGTSNMNAPAKVPDAPAKDAA